MAERRRLISRRYFLCAAPSAGLTVACGEKQIKEFQTESEGPGWRSKVVLPLGEKHPETGTYTLLLKAGWLTNDKVFGNAVVKYPIFHIEVTIDPRGEPLIVEGGLGRDDEGGPRVSWRSIITKPNLNQQNQVIVEWENWVIKKIGWNELLDIIPLTTPSQ